MHKHHARIFGFRSRVKFLTWICSYPRRYSAVFLTNTTYSFVANALLTSLGKRLRRLRGGARKAKQAKETEELTNKVILRGEGSLHAGSEKGWEVNNNNTTKFLTTDLWTISSCDAFIYWKRNEFRNFNHKKNIKEPSRKPWNDLKKQ